MLIRNSMRVPKNSQRRCLRRLSLALALSCAAYTSHASTVIVCELTGTVLTAPAQQPAPKNTVDPKSAAATIEMVFKMRVDRAVRPRQGRADSSCTDFIDRDVDVRLRRPPMKIMMPGEPVQIRYRYMDQLGGQSATSYELMSPH